MSTGEANAAAVFTRDADSYDSLRRKLIPCFDAFYGTALTLIDRWKTREDFRILDIGAGTGMFSAMVLERHPQARLCLLDASEGMLDKAKARFSAGHSVEYRLADMAEASLEGPWDLVISALAIHHLTDEGKKRLYARIHDALTPGGLFVNAEQVAGPGPVADRRYESIWLEEITRLGVPPDEIERAHERMVHDRCSPVRDQLDWIEDAGFSDVDCSFKAWRFAVFSGVKT